MPTEAHKMCGKVVKRCIIKKNKHSQYSINWARSTLPEWLIMTVVPLVMSSNNDKRLDSNSKCHTQNTHTQNCAHACTHTHTHPFNGSFSGTTQVSRYQKGKTNLDFTEARDSECQWHQLGHMQVCISLQTDNHASTLPLSFYRSDALPAAQPTASNHCT